MPRISVIMGVYYTSSQTEDLYRSVRSIQRQTYPDFEFLICDDGSSESAAALLDGMAERDKRIRLVRRDGAVTLPQKLNACLAVAGGEYVARQDADDYSAEDRFEKQVDYLDRHQAVAFVGSNAKVFCGGKICGERNFPKEPKKEDFLFRMPFLHPALMFRRSALSAANGYDESKWTVLCEDYDLLLRLYEKRYSGANLQEYLFFYQVGDQDYKKRKYRHRINEAVTRYKRFRSLNMLPRAFPFVVKPLIVGLLPHKILKLMKNRSQGVK